MDLKNSHSRVVKIFYKNKPNILGGRTYLTLEKVFKIRLEEQEIYDFVEEWIKGRSKSDLILRKEMIKGFRKNE